MNTHLTISGAYGRDYKSKAKAMADWNANRDFEIRTIGYPKYINKAQAIERRIAVTIRYNGDRDAFYIPSSHR